MASLGVWITSLEARGSPPLSVWMASLGSRGLPPRTRGWPPWERGSPPLERVVSLACAGGARVGGVRRATVTHTDVHPEFPSLRIPGLLSDPNLLPSHLSILVMVGFNKNAFKPQIAAIKDKYYEMFRNKKS
jgi:hypothetical protein